MFCVDGLQRLTAMLAFLHNEIPIFGYYLKDFEDKPKLLMGLKFNVNNLQTKKEMLQWYVDMNTGGTVHSTEEIERVKKLIESCEN